MTPIIKPHEQRVIDEKAELDIKRDALYKFFSNPIFLSLDENEKDRLQYQYQVMTIYSDILGNRIKNFKTEK